MRELSTLRTGESISMSNDVVTVAGLFAGVTSEGRVRIDTPVGFHLVALGDPVWTVRDGDGCVVAPPD